MSALYTNLAGVSTGLLKKFGQPGQIRANDTGITWAVQLVESAFSAAERANLGSFYQEGDVRVVISHVSGMAVRPGDEVFYGGRWRRVRNASSVAPAGTVVVWEAQVSG